MSLKIFHFIFIVVALLLALITGVLCFNIWQDDRAAEYQIFAITCFVSAVLLLVYGIWFMLKIKRNKELSD